ncbi:MAG: RteC domain-containing protein [Bacteroidota bacterium]|nr:RteC domain-containing protein [Bacteroidota bacterium]
MLLYAKKIYDNILSELASLNSHYRAESFSPDQRLAFVANSIQQLRTYCIQLMTVIECLDNNRQAATDIRGETSLIIPVDYQMQWTGSKVGLTEVIYAFTALGTFNNGNAGVKMISNYLENVFFVNLGNTSATFQDIRNRKTGNTKFIDSMKEGVELWIDRLD